MTCLTFAPRTLLDRDLPTPARPAGRISDVGDLRTLESPRAADDDDDDDDGDDDAEGDEDSGFDEDDLGFDGGFAPAELEEFDEADFDDDFDDDFEEEIDEDADELPDDAATDDEDDDDFDDDLELGDEPPLRKPSDKSGPGKTPPGKGDSSKGDGGKSSGLKPPAGKPSAGPGRRPARPLRDDEEDDDGLPDEFDDE